jgi:hypothetical protein
MENAHGHDFIDELSSIRKRTSVSAGASEFSNKPQRENKNRANHFPGCKLFSLLVLRFFLYHDFKQKSKEDRQNDLQV